MKRACAYNECLETLTARRNSLVLISRELLSSVLLPFLVREVSNAILRSPLSFLAGRPVCLRPAASRLWQATVAGRRSSVRDLDAIGPARVSAAVCEGATSPNSRLRGKSHDAVAMRKFVAIFNWKLSLPHKRIVLMAIGATDVSYPLPSACGIENETRCCRLHSYTSNRYSCAERERS